MNEMYENVLFHIESILCFWNRCNAVFEFYSQFENQNEYTKMCFFRNDREM